MKLTKKMLIILAVIGSTGSTILINGSRFDNNILKEEKFNPIAAERFVNTTNIRYSDLGMMKVSWYGPRFHGRLTANGEVYNQNAFTAAHKSFKFGTLLKITNMKTNKSVIVRINDRGPYIPGRQIDLSKASAEKLGVIDNGVMELKVEEIVLDWSNNPVL